jgi:4,5-DOPA dioxygenase extradiol
MTMKLPAIFVGHGNPMNALQHNQYTQGWTQIAARLPRPRAIVCISAHWFIPDTAVTVDAAPRTIHDFGGFPRELYQVRYPAPGDPALARQLQEMLAPFPVRLDDTWGLDHGTWSVLCHLYPLADIPVVQLSINESQSTSFHFELGRMLAALRDEQVLVLGSGNLVHNLHAYAWGRHAPQPYDWAVRFEDQAKQLMQSGDFAPLINYAQLGADAELCVPTPEHYLPLLYVLGTRQPGEPISFPLAGVDGGSISMLCVQVG